MLAILLQAADRVSPRRHVSMPCQVVREDDFRLLGDRALDLSMNGMQVIALRHTPVGTPVIVSFQIPDTRIYLDTEGVISRVVWGRREADQSPAFGVSFAALPPMETAVLTARLDGLPPPVPNRNLRIDYAESVRRIATAA